MKEQTPDRRPIAARESPISQRLARLLHNWGISPNTISIVSILFSIIAGVSLYFTSKVESPLFFWGAAIFILLRLLANMLDGMVAIESGKTSKLGEIFNEVPDRISDAVIFVASGYALGSSIWLGYTAAILSLLVAYIRALGNYMGVKKLFQGPMAKSHRMFTLVAVFIYLGTFSQTLPIPLLLYWTLLIIVLGSLVTFIRRLARIVSEVTT